jgi:sugar (pentulose or hexulose) kinase
MPQDPLYLGIDLGTGGVRALVVRAAGEVIASSSVPFPKSTRTLPPGHHEQDANEWWTTTQQAIAGAMAILREKRIAPDAISALAIDGTSGTIVGVTADGNPTGPALMYSDSRATLEARELAELAAKDGPSPAGQIAASYAIAKIRWLEKQEPGQFQRSRWFLHQADFIAAKLTGQFGVTDYSNALKTGYNLIADRWPAWLDNYPAIRKRLPQVLPPGATLGTLSTSTLAPSPPLLRVIAGATDGTAAFLASGARSPGDDNTTLGTTLVFKRIASHPVIDPRGLIYCHKLPGGLWLPGAASNTGCEWMTSRFSIFLNFSLADLEAASLLPCPRIAYPLVRQGERFPFLSLEATGFIDDALVNALPDNPYFDYAAHLQGVAMIERLCYDTLNAATQVQAGDVFATGGGSHSDIWMQLRADVTGRVYHRPACPQSAFGAAVLAASADHGGLWKAIAAMVRIERRFDPDPAKKAAYDAIFARFTAAMRERGWLQS